MLLEIDNIELGFGSKKVLYGIYLSARKGEVTGILGRNGCGKTSLLNILFGSLKPKYKSIRIDGKNIRKALFLFNNIAYLPQHRLLPKNMGINTAFRLFDVDWNAFTDYFDDFRAYEKYRVSMLSSGEVRIIETYLTMNQNKEIILLDEPFSFVAPIYVDKFKTIIQEKKEDRITLITDHFYNDILEVSNKIYFLRDGCSKEIKTDEDLTREGYVISNSRQKMSPK